MKPIEEMNLIELRNFSERVHSLLTQREKDAKEQRKNELIKIRDDLQQMMRDRNFVITYRNNFIALDDASENGKFNISLFDGMEW